MFLGEEKGKRINIARAESWLLPVPRPLPQAVHFAPLCFATL